MHKFHVRNAIVEEWITSSFSLYTEIFRRLAAANTAGSPARVFRSFVFSLLVLGLLGTPASAFSQSQGGGAAAARAEAEDLTQSLVALHAHYRWASATTQASMLGELVDLAAARAELLAELVEENPGQVLKTALPARLRARMPPEVQVYLEAKQELEGTLTVVYEDDDRGGRTRYFLDTDGERYGLKLHFKAHPPAFQTGAAVRVNGLLLAGTSDGDLGATDGAMAVESGETGVEVLALDGDGSGTPSTALSNTFGEQRTVVLLVNYQDYPEEPYTLQQANDLVFGTVSDFFLENSFGQTWLTGDVYGWYTLPMDQPIDPATCKTQDIAQAAQAAAQNAGVDLSAYDRYVYVFPHTSCLTAGSGTVGGTPSEAWINGPWFTLKTVGHELGHNLGLYHSGAVECGDTTVGGDCQTYPYGDTMDIMGNQSVGHFNGFQKERLGWLDPSLGHIETIDVDGVYTLEAYELDNASAPKSVRVPKDTDPVTGETTWYYVEYRQGIGFDDFLADNDNVLNGVVVREATESTTPSTTASMLLDMTPNSLAYGDWGDPALVFGETFSDPETGLMITSQWGDGSQATVDVSFGPPSCVRANPSVTTSPAESQWVEAGTGVDYAITVTNGDNAGCNASSFELGASIPVGWAATFAEPLLPLGPGASVSTTLTVTSMFGESDGFYAIGITAENTADPSYAASGSATYVISQDAGNQAPTPVDDSATTEQDTPVVIDILANDSDPDGDPLAVVSVTPGANGTITVNADGTITHSPKSKFKGEDSFSYSVTDGGQTGTATVTVTVTRSSRGGNNGGGNGKGKPGK